MLTKKTKIVVCMNWVYKMWEIKSKFKYKS